MLIAKETVISVDYELSVLQARGNFDSGVIK